MANKSKKVVVTAEKKASTIRSKSASSAIPADLMMKKDNYIWMSVGVLLIALGLALMAGGKMPSPDVWDENVIYSFRRTVLAPVVILAGLSIEIYAIFKK
jgi:sulfite exporter TauE/SafE